LKDGSVKFFLAPAWELQEEMSTAVKVDSYAAPCAVDFDNDGITDLAVGASDKKIHFFKGTEEGFEKIDNFFGEIEAGDYPAPAAWDVNSDGKLDLVSGNRKGQIKTFLAPDWQEYEEGLGIFSPGNFAAPAFGDFNSGGQQAFIIGALDGTIRFHENKSGTWLELPSWKFLRGEVIFKVEDYFTRCHLECSPLRGMRDQEALAAFTESLAGAENHLLDEAAFAIAGTPTEMLRTIARMENADLMVENARCIYDIAGKLPYTSIKEKADYTTLEYTGADGNKKEIPRDIYYWWVVHPRISYDIPARIDISYWLKSHKDYGIMETPWLKHKVGLKMYDHGPNSHFWRKYIPDCKRYGDSLLDVVTQAKTMQEAAYLLSDWLCTKNPGPFMRYGFYTQDGQPLVIFMKHYGSCGELSMTATTCARTALIPIASVAINGGDHAWAEFWLDREWHQWDLGNEPNGLGYPWNSSEGFTHRGAVPRVSRRRGDDLRVTSTQTVANPEGVGYTSSGRGYTDVGTFDVKIVDGNNYPVEGALVVVRSHGYSYRIADYDYSNPQGMCYFALGKAPKGKYTINVISRLGITGTASFSIKENTSRSIRYVLPGDFNGRIPVEIPEFPLAQTQNTISISAEVLAEEQRPPHMSTGRLPASRKRESGLAEKTGYLGTRWYSHPARANCGIFFCHLDPNEFELFKTTRQLPRGKKILDWSADLDFNPSKGEVFLFFNANQYTHVRFDTTVMARLPKADPVIELDPPCRSAKTGEKISFSGKAADNLHLTTLEFSSDGGSTWRNITATVDRDRGRFTYIWNTGEGGPMLPGTYFLVFRATDAAGNSYETKAISCDLLPAREFKNQLIYQDNPDTPLPKSSWILGPFQLKEPERFLGIITSGEQPEFDMDMF
ncbi:FG-GAP-like repeat-containing protein, partial [Planctomycetota bacterium]